MEMCDCKSHRANSCGKHQIKTVQCEDFTIFLYFSLIQINSRQDFEMMRKKERESTQTLRHEAIL